MTFATIRHVFFNSTVASTVMGFVDMAWAPSSTSVDSKVELLGKKQENA